MTIYATEAVRYQQTASGNSQAFIKLMKLCRPLGDIDEAVELDSWRQEKYMHERLD